MNCNGEILQQVGEECLRVRDKTRPESDVDRLLGYFFHAHRSLNAPENGRSQLSVGHWQHGRIAANLAVAGRASTPTVVCRSRRAEALVKLVCLAFSCRSNETNPSEMGRSSVEMIREWTPAAWQRCCRRAGNSRPSPIHRERLCHLQTPLHRPSQSHRPSRSRWQ